MNIFINLYITYQFVILVISVFASNYALNFVSLDKPSNLVGLYFN
jgi:hypothetical protein